MARDVHLPRVSATDIATLLMRLREILGQLTMGKPTTTTLKLILGGLILLTAAFGQEPKQPLAKQVSSTGGSTPTIDNGAPQQAAPVIEPKALPAMNPPLGDIARQARM